MLDYVLYIPASILAIMYGGMPLLVWSQNKFPGRYSLTQAPKEAFLQEADETFRSLVEEIEENGFRYVLSTGFHQQVTQTRFSVFTHNEKMLSATLAHISNPNVPNITYLEISQIFDDDTMLDVNNAPMSGTFPKSSRKVSFRFPEVTEVAHLVEITERILHNYLGTKRAVTLPEGNELKMIERYLNEEQNELVDKGYLQKSVKDNERGLTLLGAYLMTWKMLWPVKQLRERKELAFANRIIQ